MYVLALTTPPNYAYQGESFYMLRLNQIFDIIERAKIPFGACRA